MPPGLGLALLPLAFALNVVERLRGVLVEGAMMSEAQKDTQRAIFAGMAIIDKRDPHSEFGAILVTLKHTISSVLLTLMRDPRKAAAMLNEGLVQGVGAYSEPRTQLGGKKRDPNWARVMGPFALGSTYAAQLCARFGIRPDAFGIKGQSR